MSESETHLYSIWRLETGEHWKVPDVGGEDFGPEYQSRIRDEVVDVVDALVSAPMLERQRSRGSRHILVDRHPLDRGAELLKLVHFVVAHAGKQFKSNDFAGGDCFVRIDKLQ